MEPENARIFIDGEFYGEGVVTVTAPKKDDFVSVRAECPGYEDLNVKIYGVIRERLFRIK